MLVRQFEDSEGKIIGFIGFADREDTTPFTDEELQTIHLLLGSLSKEIAVREYKEREVRASNTLGSIMNNMGVDIYVNSFDSHDMLYANASMAAPYGGIKRQGYIEIMQENTELLLQLISDILDLSKIEAGTLDFNMGYLNIRDFCEDILRGYEIKEDKPVPVVLASGLPDYRIYTDKKRLMQVITNFINNALKFTSKGQITLEYHFKEGTNEIEFSVTDTGIGIAPDAVGQVFDRFVKLNTFSKGTGLGLSICRSIVEHLGGTIGAESEVGVGSRFWFTHPCAESA